MADTTKLHTCKTCGAVYGEDDEGNVPNTTADGKCSMCGVGELEANEHPVVTESETIHIEEPDDE